MNLIPRDRFFDLDKFFDDFWSPQHRMMSEGDMFFTPRVDIHEKDKHYEITAEIPGLKKEDIHLTLEDGVLTLTAESSKDDKEEKEGKVIRRERRYGKYMRSFNVGNDVTEKDIAAGFENGVLKLTIPKVEEKAPVQKRIQIS